MTNVEKVKDKMAEDVDRAIESSDSREEFERKMDPHDVSYKTKDRTKEGRRQPYRTNQ